MCVNNAWKVSSVPHLNSTLLFIRSVFHFLSAAACLLRPNVVFPEYKWGKLYNKPGFYFNTWSVIMNNIWGGKELLALHHSPAHILMSCSASVSPPSLMLMYSWMLMTLMFLCVSCRTNTQRKWGRTRSWRRKPAGRGKEKREKKGGRLGVFWVGNIKKKQKKEMKTVQEKKKNSKATRTKRRKDQFSYLMLRCSDPEEAVRRLADSRCWNSKRNLCFLKESGRRGGNKTNYYKC